MARTLARIVIGAAAAVSLFRIIGEKAERRKRNLEKRAVCEALIAGRNSPATSPSGKAYFDALRARTKPANRVDGERDLAASRKRTTRRKTRSIVELAGSVDSSIRGVSIEDMNPWRQGPSLAWLFRLAKDVWDDRSDAWAWMSTPHFELGGKTPIEAATTRAGAERVEDILWRVVYGISP
jgi:hypothetical protein